MEGPNGEKSKKNQERVTTHKLSPESGEYTTHLEGLKNYYDVPDEEHCFAGRELSTIDFKERLLRAKRGEKTNIPSFMLGKYTEESLIKEKNASIKQTKERFLLRFEHPSASGPAKSIFIEAFENPELNSTLQSILAKVPQKSVPKKKLPRTGPDSIIEGLFRIGEKERNAELLVYALRHQLLDDDIWIRILQNHQIRFEEQSKEFNEKIEPEFRNNFLISLTNQSSSGGIPISMERVLKTLELVTVKLDDAIEHLFDERWGSYDPRSHVALIGSENLRYKKILYRTYCHEMFHALSGKTVRAVSDTEYDEILDPDRIGLMIVGKFRWLNEAVTESLTQLVVDQERNTYLTERKILGFILGESGLTLQDFARAYFEHYEPDERGTETGAIAGWKNISSKISDKLGEGFLQRLDKKIKLDGEKNALDALQKGEM